MRGFGEEGNYAEAFTAATTYTVEAGGRLMVHTDISDRDAMVEFRCLSSPSRPLSGHCTICRADDSY